MQLEITPEIMNDTQLDNNPEVIPDDDGNPPEKLFVPIANDDKVAKSKKLQKLLAEIRARSESKVAENKLAVMAQALVQPMANDRKKKQLVDFSDQVKKIVDAQTPSKSPRRKRKPSKVEPPRDDPEMAVEVTPSEVQGKCLKSSSDPVV